MGVVISVEEFSDWDAESSIFNNGGFLALDGNLSGLTVADDVPVYTITIPDTGPEDTTVTTGAAVDLNPALTLATKDFAYIIEYKNTVAAIYIVVDNR